MKMLNKMKYWTGALIISALVITACGDDEQSEAPELTIEALTATGTDLETGEETTKDLNAATSADDVPPNSIFTITFDRDIDESTANNSNITIIDGENNVTTTVTTNGNVVTVTPEDDLIQGTDYTINVSSAVESTDGGSVNNGSRSFSTAGRLPVVAPQEENMAAYWKLDGNASDETGNFADGTEVTVEYQADRFGTIESAAYFDGDASIIEIADAGSLLTETQDFTVSFWLKTDTTNHLNDDGNQTGMFVFGLGAFYGIQYEIFGSYDGSKYAVSYVNDAGTQYAEDMFFPSNATDNTTGGWQGWDFARSLTPNEMQDIIAETWYHNLFTYNASEKKGYLYFNGQLMKSFNFNLWPEGDAKQTTVGVDYRGAEPEVFDDLALGFIHSRAGSLFDADAFGNYENPNANHFKGWLDDFRIFHSAYTAADVTALYNAERP